MTYAQLYSGGGTDIQRLLNNLKPDTPRPRRCGRTYTTLLHIAGQVIYGPKHVMFLYLGENTHMASIVRQEFITILEEKNIVCLIGTPPYVRIPDTGQNFIFSTMDNWPHDARGYTINQAFIDVFNAPAHGVNYQYLGQVCHRIHPG